MTSNISLEVAKIPNFSEQFKINVTIGERTIYDVRHNFMEILPLLTNGKLKGDILFFHDNTFEIDGIYIECADNLLSNWEQFYKMSAKEIANLIIQRYNNILNKAREKFPKLQDIYKTEFSPFPEL